MAKRLKLKLSRVIPSLQFCRSKHSSTSAETPLLALYRLSPVNAKAFDITYPNLPAPPPSTPEYSFIKRHVSPKVVSVGCGCRSGSCKKDLYSYCGIKSPDYTRKKEAAASPPCHVASNYKPHEPKHQTKLYDASSDGGISPVWVNEKYKKKQRNKKEKKTKASVSSRCSGFFSSEEEEEYKETDTFLSSSRSFSNDSSFEIDHSLESTSHDFYNSESTKPTKKKVNTNINIKKIRRLRRYASKNYKGSNNTTVLYPEIESPVKASILRRMIPCPVEGKVRESVAVVKKSVDPYEDFKRSMLEMILEKEMFEAKDLEELLQCFLSLNSRQYHRIIVDAFSEIWEVLFCDSPVRG